MKSTEKQSELFSNADLKALIIPLVLEQALAVTVGMADTVMISSAGEAAVSGVSLVDMLNMLIFSMLSALATGGTVVASQYLGAGKRQDACRAARQVLFTVLVFSLLMAGGMILFRRSLLRLFFGRIEDAVMEAALIYLVISALSFPFLGLYNACAALFRAMGRTKTTFTVSVIGNLINIAGNALCIYGLHMGVAGVALPSLLSRAVMGLLLYRLLKNPNLTLHFDRERFRLDGAMIRRVLYIGVPGGLENGVFQLGRVLVVSIISGFGTIQIAANGVANSLDSMGCIIGQAMNLAMVAVIGRCAGTRDLQQIRFYTRKLLLITYAATAVLNSLMLLFLTPILSLYRLSPETTELAYTLVMIHNGLAIFLWPLSFVFPNMLRACNDVRFPMVISIFSMFAFRIGFSYILGVGLGMGAIGVWIAMVIDWVFRLICFVGRYFHGDWKRTLYRLNP